MKKRPEKKPGRTYTRTLSAVAVAEAERCRQDPNIVAVGFGLKFAKGRPTMQVALHYYVRQKLSSEDEIRALGSEPVPVDIDGYATDVVQWMPDRALACPEPEVPTGERGSRKEDPLVGGTSTTVLADFYSFPTGYGTLGGICFDVASGDAMALSNAHVYGEETGNDAIQPFLPTSEYLEATAKYLFCGGPLAHLFFWTAPSPLTAILTTAAAGAWVAAAASDAEDPSRWGQRTGPVPPAGETTERERIRIEADVPHLPFPGRVWRTKTSWDYTRITGGGTLSTSTTEARVNEHVLAGKRVFTDRRLYQGGQSVQICAELFTPTQSRPIERFVVAHCFPLADPGRIIRRVLTLDDGRCRKMDQPGERICVRGFSEQVPGVTQVSFRYMAPPFILFSDAPVTHVLFAGAAGNPSGLNALRLPQPAGLKIACPPSTHIELHVFSHGGGIEAIAISANGLEAARAQTSGPAGEIETLTLSGLEIVRIELRSLRGDGYLVGLCVDKRRIGVPDHIALSRFYSGSIKLEKAEPPGRWGVMVVSQSLDDTPTGGDPVDAARKLSGVVDSANVVEIGPCVCTILYDATFEVG
jgi:hypothetical protein